jgi:hypothetical protein
MGPHRVGLDLKEIGSLECGWYQGAHHHVGGWPFSIAAQSWWEHHMQHDHQSCSANHAMVLLALPPLPQPVTPDSLSTSSNFPLFHQSNYLQHQHTWRTSQELGLTSAEWGMGQPKSCRHVEHCCSWSCESTKAKTHRKALVAKITLMLILKTRKEKVGGCVPSPPCKIEATNERGKLPHVAWSICVHYHYLLMMRI